MNVKRKGEQGWIENTLINFKMTLKVVYLNYLNFDRSSILK